MVVVVVEESTPKQGREKGGTEGKGMVRDDHAWQQQQQSKTRAMIGGDDDVFIPKGNGNGIASSLCPAFLSHATSFKLTGAAVSISAMLEN